MSENKKPLVYLHITSYIGEDTARMQSKGSAEALAAKVVADPDFEGDDLWAVGAVDPDTLVVEIVDDGYRNEAEARRSWGWRVEKRTEEIMARGQKVNKLKAFAAIIDKINEEKGYRYLEPDKLTDNERLILYAAAELMAQEGG